MLETLGRSIFLREDLADKKLLSSFESFELEAQFSEIKDEVWSIEFLNIILIEFCCLLVIVSKCIGSSEISNDALVIVSLLICFLIGYCSFFRLVDLNHSVAIYLEVLEGRYSLDDLEVTLRISFSAL